MERIKGQNPPAAEPENADAKSTSFAPTLLKNITDKARRRVLRAASRLSSWYRK